MTNTPTSCAGSSPGPAPTGCSDHIAQTARWRQEYINCCGRKAQPRLSTWFGLGFSAEGRYRDPLDAQPWTPELVTLRDELGQVVNTSFNALLVNRYRSGRDYVCWHSDDERRLGVDPLIASVSLGPARQFCLRRRVDGLRVDFELRARRCARHGRTLPEQVGTPLTKTTLARGEVQPHPPMLRTPVKVACSAPGR
ncbi:MAG: alpha-ketoglutarate-dependent dioxygenase AlkB [Acidimicrobiia bacterium]|nr:alpha-ketoglutarate-dependent dioxygenase AlkB [Acidimicrobiia bacterium]